MPTVTNYNVSGLSAYVQENRYMIIKSFALAAPGTRSRVGIQTGIKGTMRLHYLDFDPVIQDGSDCGFNPLDEATISQRPITVVPMKHDGELCPASLLGKYAEYLVRINATEQDFPFERYLIEAMTNALNKKIETFIWQGKTVAHSGTDLIDGWLYQMDNDASVIDVSIASGSSAYAGITAVYAAMPEDTLTRGGVIFVSPAIFRSFLLEMVALNLYHYSGAVNDNPDEFILPGSDVRVIKTPGLASSLKIVGTFADNLVYGTDMENDEEDLDVWYSKDKRRWCWTALWASGVSYHFPAQVVLGTFAAAPTAPTPGVTALGQIAENTTPTS